MRRIRVIPTLLINSSGGLIKTINFGKRTYIGDPINAVKIFNEKCVDELVLLDVDATKNGREPNYELVEEIASEAFMPIGYGGGIKTVEQMQRLYRCGLEKVILSTAAHESPELIAEASQQFGSQSVVVCLDVKRTLFSGYRVTTRSGSYKTRLDPASAARNAMNQGAGEIMVYSIDKDGTYSGYDENLLHLIADRVNVPVIACGGARGLSDFYTAIANSGCSAVAAGSMFVFQGQQRGVLISYPLESELREHLYDRLD